MSRNLSLWIPLSKIHLRDCRFTIYLFYSTIVVILLVLVLLTMPWIDFHDVSAFTWTALAPFGNMSPYQFGGIYFPLPYKFLQFLMLLYLQVGKAMSLNMGQLLNVYSLPIISIPLILHQITFQPSIMINIIILAKFAVLVIDVLIALFVFMTIQGLHVGNAWLCRMTFAFILLNPVIFCVFFNLVKLDEALAILGITVVFYLLKKSIYSPCLVTSFSIGVFSVIPFLSKGYFPFLPFVALFMLWKLTQDRKNIIICFVGSVLMVLPNIQSIISWYNIQSAVGISGGAHPGFYTIFSLARLGGPDYMEKVGYNLNAFFTFMFPFIIILPIIYAVLVLISIRRRKLWSLQDYLQTVTNYLLFEEGIRLLVTPAVLIQYLPMMITLYVISLFSRWNRHIYLKLLVYYVLSIFTSIAFILYEQYNFPLGALVFQKFFDADVVKNQIYFMNRDFWLPQYQRILMPSFMAGFILWFFPFIKSALNIPKSLKQSNRFSDNKRQSPSVTRFCVPYIMVIILLSAMYLQPAIESLSLSYAVDSKRIAIAYGSKNCKLNLPTFPSSTYTIISLPEEHRNVFIRIINATDCKRYGVFSSQLFKFMAYLDVPSQLARLGINNITSSNNANFKIGVLYCDYPDDVSEAIQTAIYNFDIVITVGMCKFIFENVKVNPGPSFDALSEQGYYWRSILVIPHFIEAPNCELLYNDSLLTILRISDNKILGILKTSIVLPSLPFGDKAVSQDIAAAILKVLAIINGDSYETSVDLRHNSDIMVVIPQQFSIHNKVTITIIQQPIWWFPVTYVKTINY